ncbi:MAG: hypothetical protein U0M23_09000 [Acutalibacteraceae bacterium]|nr:hypothetical protein [Acutalibacteraceae bacterium]HIR03383.1 hypothetical protein [Candidatus Scatovicinus merdipullorum]
MKAKTSFFNWTLPHPIIIPSGPLTNNIALIKKAFEQGACAAVTKTISCERKSYQGIRHFPDKITFNQEGYSSRSPSEWAADWPALQGQPVIANIHGNSPSAFAGLAEYLVRSGAEILELGVSCPTFGEEPACYHLAELEKICSSVRKAVPVPVIAKVVVSMSKRLNRDMAKCILDTGLDGITVSDSLPAACLSSGDKKCYGGLTGPFLKPLVLRALYDIQDINLCKIAVGGVFSSQDAEEYLQCGATLVGVCSCILQGGWKNLHQIIEPYIYFEEEVDRNCVTKS